MEGTDGAGMSDGSMTSWTVERSTKSKLVAAVSGRRSEHLAKKEEIKRLLD